VKLRTILGVALLLMMVVGVVATIYYFEIKQTGTIEIAMGLEVYLDNELLTNQSTIAWGNMKRGNTYQFDNLTIKNIGNVNTKVILIVLNLPLNCIQTWSANNTVLVPNKKVEAPLVLNIGYDAVPGSYNWNLIINTET